MEENLEETPRKKKLRRQLLQAVSKCRVKAKRVRVLGQKIRRYKKKILCLKQVTKDLTNKNLVPLENSRVLNNLPGITKNY